MPSFCSPFSVKKSDRMLTETEIVRVLRYNIAAEYEAAQLYEQVAESIDNADVKKVLLEVADDERVHAGCFYKILTMVCPEEANYYEQGCKEIEELLSKKDD